MHFLKLKNFIVLGIICSTNCSAQVDVLMEDKRTIYSELDYLFWTATQDGLSYATISSATIPATDGLSYLGEKDLFLDPKWSSGVRGSLGIKPLNSFWDTNLSYTYYSTKSSKSVHAESLSIASSPSDKSAGKILLGTFSYDLFAEFPGPMEFDNASSWKLNFNRIDWELGRKIVIGSDFSLRPFFGLQGLSTTQKVSGSLNTVFLGLYGALPITNVITLNGKNCFDALGLRTGFNGSFHFGYGFDFYGNISGSILWGKFEINQECGQVNVNSEREMIALSKETIDHSHQASIFNCDLGLGFDWKHCFVKTKQVVLLRFGWEQHFYTDINRFQNFCIGQIDGGNRAPFFDRNGQRGNLSLSGFVVGVFFAY